MERFVCLTNVILEQCDPESDDRYAQYTMDEIINGSVRFRLHISMSTSFVGNIDV